MHENSGNISTALSQAASSKATAVGATAVAGAVAVTAKDPYALGNFIDTVAPTGHQALGTFLATNGPAIFGDPVLSWAELATIGGSIFVTYQLLKIAVSLIKDLVAASIKFYNFCLGFKRKPIKIKPRGATHAKYPNSQ